MIAIASPLQLFYRRPCLGAESTSDGPSCMPATTPIISRHESSAASSRLDHGVRTAFPCKWYKQSQIPPGFFLFSLAQQLSSIFRTPLTNKTQTIRNTYLKSQATRYTSRIPTHTTQRSLAHRGDGSRSTGHSHVAGGHFGHRPDSLQANRPLLPPSLQPDSDISARFSHALASALTPGQRNGPLACTVQD